MSGSSDAIFFRAFSAAIGEGSYNPFANSNDVAYADLANAKLRIGPGQSNDFRYGFVDYRFRLVRAKSAVAQGDLVTPFVRSTGTFASSTKAISTTAASYTASELASGLVVTKAGTGLNQLRFIKDNSDDAGASTITVATFDNTYNTDAISTPDAWTTLPDGTTTFTAYCPWDVDKSAAATDFVIGVALNTVTAGNWTIILEKGPAMTKVVGSTDATTALGPVVPSATAGTAKGPTAAGITAAEAARVFGYAVDAYAGAALLRLVQFFGRFNS